MLLEFLKKQLKLFNYIEELLGNSSVCNNINILIVFIAAKLVNKKF